MEKFRKTLLSNPFLPFTLALGLLTLDILYLLFLHYFIETTAFGLWTLIDLLIFLLALGLLLWMGINLLTALIRKHWRQSLLRVGILLLALVIFIPTVSVNFTTITSLSSSRDDLFGKDIVLPEGMVVYEPLYDDPGPISHDSTIDFLSHSWDDVNYKEYLGQYKEKAQKEIPIKIRNMPLPDLAPNKEKYLRHFAADAKWELTRDKNTWVARIRPINNGYWDSERLYIGDVYNHTGTGEIYIGIKNAPVRLQPDYVVAEEGTFITTTTPWRGGIHTQPVFVSGQTRYTIVERAYTKDRPFTESAFDALVKELHVIRGSKVVMEQGYEPSVVGTGSVIKGKEALELRTCGEAGVYCLDAYVNPGEWGYVFVRAFEATSNKALSVDFIRKSTKEYIGWSKHPDDKFIYNTKFQIDEGGPRYRFPVRFEIWFHPDNRNEPERELLDKTFWVYGHEDQWVD